VIAEAGADFLDALRQLVEVAQADAPYRISRRDSRQGTYVAYHLEIYVFTADEALERKSLIAQLEGVRVML
jgi:putative lipoic acid-binding regulatory protein